MKKRTVFFALVCLLGAFAPAIAHAWQPEPESHAHTARAEREPGVHATTEGEHAAAEHEEAREHDGPAPINWFDFSNKEQPPFGAMIINFVVLMAMYYALGKKPVAEGLKARRASIAKEIEEAQRMRHEAEERASKYQEKLQHLEVELKETRETMRASGEADRERIVRDAEEKAARMEKDAKFLIEQELKQMRVELTREAIDMATIAAEELLKKRITPADQERLAEDYLAELVARRPSGSHDARPAAGGE